MLATGGTVEAMVGLVEQLGGVVVGVLFIIELDFLTAASGSTGYDVHSLIHY